MSRFKKPLSGLSRLSDRQGKTVVNFGPRIMFSRSANSGNITFSQPDVGDLIVYFGSGSTNNVNPANPSGFTQITTSASSPNGTRIIASYKVVDGPITSVGTQANTGWRTVIVIKDHKGIGKFVRGDDGGGGNSGELSGLSLGSRMLVGVSTTYSISSSAGGGEPLLRVDTGTVSNVTFASVNLMDEGQSFGGVWFAEGALSGSKFITLEVLSA